MDKPARSFWQIWNMSFGFLGIQFGWGLQMANMSAIYEYLGARADQIPILWLAAPLTGLIVQPIIGHASDRTWGSVGRRRPYFLTGAILSSLALVLMPNSSSLWMAAGLLWILDASINISMEPFRAFVADLLPKGSVPGASRCRASSSGWVPWSRPPCPGFLPMCFTSRQRLARRVPFLPRFVWRFILVQPHSSALSSGPYSRRVNIRPKTLKLSVA
jgi:hypothetical protein